MFFFVGVLCTRVDLDRGPHPNVVLWVSSGSGVRCFAVVVACGRGSDVQSVKRHWTCCYLSNSRAQLGSYVLERSDGRDLVGSDTLIMWCSYVRTSAKSWYKASKHGLYGEFFFFLLQIYQHKYPEGSTNTPCDRYEFTPVKKQNSIIHPLRKCGLRLEVTRIHRGQGPFPPLGP